jgi:FAD/FMN-containing dehydrogenase
MLDVPRRLDDLIRDRFLEDLGDVPVVTDPLRVRKKSRDFFWYSPVLNEQLKDCAGDVLVEARSEQDVIATAAACARHGVPLTVRGGGTGNYGQCVPLQGGVVLDMTGFDTIEWHRGDVVRAAPGIHLNKLDEALRPNGWESRMHPSTKRTASLGGFIAGGSGGVGSVNWGGLVEAGNINAARVVTVEPEPRIIELRADAAQKINRAYGTTGIITALEMPLAAAYRWIDVVVAFDTIAEALRCGEAVAHADGVAKKLVTPIGWPLPRWFTPLKDAAPAGASLLLCMIAEGSLEPFRDIVRTRGGRITHEQPTAEEPGQVPLYEYTWNHTTLQVLKTDRSYTYLQLLYPAERAVDSALKMIDMFGDELMPHFEFIRFGGRMTMSGLPVLRYESRERLWEIIALHEANGVMVANPHVVTLEDGSRHKRANADQLGFKREVDPAGLLNPGKMRSYVPAGTA